MLPVVWLKTGITKLIEQNNTIKNKGITLNLKLPLLVFAVTVKTILLPKVHQQCTAIFIIYCYKNYKYVPGTVARRPPAGGYINSIIIKAN
jgi:hypothetical protein